MTRFTTLAAACVAAAVIIALPASAKQDKPNRSDWFEPCQIEYLDVYEKAYEAGHDVGANLVDDHNAGCAEIAESTSRLKAWLNPPEVEVAEEAPVEEAATTTYAPPATSSGGCPSSMAGEASSPSAVNPTSGASGCYQVIPSTAAAMGSACSDVNAPSCLAAICAAQGNGAWVAADPCKAKLE